MERTELFDRLLAAISVVVLSPVLLLRAIAGLCQTGRFLESSTVSGRGGRPVALYQFSGKLPGARLAHLLNIMTGELAFVGPRVLDLHSSQDLLHDHPERFRVRPGLVSPASLRRRMGMDHQGELTVELEFIDKRSISGNLSLLLRSLLSRIVYGRGDQPAPEQLSFFDIPVANTSMDEALDWIVLQAENRAHAVLQFVNPHCLNVAYSDQDYRAALLDADRILPDGSGIQLGCRVQGLALRGNLNGTDLFPLLCDRASDAELSLFLLGGQAGIAQATADNMLRRFPALRIAGYRDGFFDEEDVANVIEEINGAGADILLVAMGVPRQELWLSKHRAELRPGLCMGVGGLFDFYSGRIPRAPVWLRELGLEWTWRLLQEPRRMWRRYVIGNPLFLWRVWREVKRSDGHPNAEDRS